MGFTKILLPALALASGTLAQGSKCSGTKTIQNAGDATALSSCPTISGDVKFAPAAAGAIMLDGVREITGALTIVGASNLTSLEANQLSSIGGTWTMRGLINLNSLSMPFLNSVDTITWTALPALEELSFTGGVSKANNLNIIDTQLGDLNGINLTSAQTIYLSNNVYLKEVNMPVTEVTNMLSISANGQNGLNAAFPQLVSAGMIAISNCSGVDLSSLKNTTEGLILSGNGFTNISAPKLTSTAGLSILNNNGLQTMSFPQLQMCSQEFRVENNTAFTGTISFPQLTTITGAARFLGAFSGLSVPKLNSIRGTAYIRSTKNIQSVCDHFDQLGNEVQGRTDCKGRSVNQGGSATGSMPSGTSSASSSNTSGSSASNIAKPALGLSALIAGFIGLLL